MTVKNEYYKNYEKDFTLLERIIKEYPLLQNIEKTAKQVFQQYWTHEVQAVYFVIKSYGEDQAIPAVVENEELQYYRLKDDKTYYFDFDNLNKLVEIILFFQMFQISDEIKKMMESLTDNDIPCDIIRTHCDYSLIYQKEINAFSLTGTVYKIKQDLLKVNSEVTLFIYNAKEMRIFELRLLLPTENFEVLTELLRKKGLNIFDTDLKALKIKFEFLSVKPFFQTIDKRGYCSLMDYLEVFKFIHTHKIRIFRNDYEILE